MLTHAHTDHAGNCKYLRDKYGAPIAMHAGDSGKVSRGDMFWTRQGNRTFATRVAKVMLSVIGMGSFDRFEPDVLLQDGQGLGTYGLDATVVRLPGHSPGQVGYARWTERSDRLSWSRQAVFGRVVRARGEGVITIRIEEPGYVSGIHAVNEQAFGQTTEADIVASGSRVRPATD